MVLYRNILGHLAQSVEHVTLDLRLVSSSPTLGVEPIVKIYIFIDEGIYIWVTIHTFFFFLIFSVGREDLKDSRTNSIPRSGELCSPRLRAGIYIN